MYQRYAKFHCNRSNRRKFVDGALYTDLFEDCTDIITPITDRVIELDVTIQSTGEHTSILIYCSSNENDQLLIGLNKLGEAMKLCPDNTNRRKNDDIGMMHVIGKGRLGNGSVGVYKLTDSSHAIATATREITQNAKRYYNACGLGDDIDILKKKSHKYGQMGDNFFFVSTIVQSHDLVNSAHYDCDDATISIATWTEQIVYKERKWFFILPNTTRDGRSGIIIPLRHGITIRWDGSKIFHCSMIGEDGGNGHLWSTLFGCKK